MNVLQLIFGVVIIAAAVYAVMRKVDVRLALIPAGLLMGTLAGQPMAIVQKFLETFTDGKFVVPICCAMGFAYVLKFTQCDQHLVQLLVKPLRYVRNLLIPGAVLVGFLVNIPIISQTSTAVAIGAVLIPLLFAAEISPITAGAALLLGASVGGELLNPGAPEFGTIVKEVEGVRSLTRADLINYTLPFNLVQLSVATAVFWWFSARAEASHRKERAWAGATVESDEPFRVDLLKAAVPLVPLVLLFLTSRAFHVISVPQEWLVSPKELTDLPAAAAEKKAYDLFDSRLIGAAMLVGVAAAALTTLSTRAGRKEVLETARTFFAGAGYAFAEIIGIIVAASCFAKGVELIGIGDLIGKLVTVVPALLLPVAGFVPMSFAVVSGSGMAATQGLFKLFVDPAVSQGFDPAQVGAIVSLGAAAGRTMSPVAAVALMSAKLTNTSSADLSRRVALPLLLGLTAAILVGTVIIAREAKPPAASAVSSMRADRRADEAGLSKKLLPRK